MVSSMDTITTPTRSNLDTVQGIYDAFGRGDLPAILDVLDPQVAWEHWDSNSAQDAGVPHLQAVTGHDGVASFFGIIAGFTYYEFQVRGLAAGPDVVLADIHVDVEFPNGQRFTDDELHLWRFGPDGAITELRHYVDTAKHIAASQAPPFLRSQS